MKKAITLIVVLCLFLFGITISACSKPASPPASTISPSASPVTEPPAQEAIVWKGQAYYVPGGPVVGHLTKTDTGEPVRAWVEWVKKATNGRLTIELVSPGAIVPTSEYLSATQQGVVPITTGFAGVYSGTMPEAAIESYLPFALENVEKAYVAIYRYGVFELLQEAYAERNVHLLTLYPITGRVNFGTTFPVDKLDAFKGKKIRAPGTYADLASMLGASPSPIPFQEVYMAMQLGTVDGFVVGVMNLEVLKLTEVTKYFLNTTNGFCNNNILINMNAWNKLPNDIKDLLDANTRHVVATYVLEYLAAEDYFPDNLPMITMQQWSKEDETKVKKMAIENIWPTLGSKNTRCGQLVEMFKTFYKDWGGKL